MEMDDLLNKTIRLPSHFSDAVKVVKTSNTGSIYKLLVRREAGHFEEVVLTEEDIQELIVLSIETGKPALAEDLALFVESHRIKYAYSYDPYYAVSLSEIQALPYQLVAVYEKMLPQPHIRFLLADDPGAGKTIMAGLLVKELKLRNAIERILVIVPSALTPQWQDDLFKFFNEQFFIADAGTDKGDVQDIWAREDQIITSIDYAKQEGIREKVWLQNWDIIIVDEAHKCAAYTKRSRDRTSVIKTKRYQLVEELSLKPCHLLLLTATPHYGDDDRFRHFLRLIDPDVFPEPHKFRDEAQNIKMDILHNKDNPWILRRLKEEFRGFDGKRLFTKRNAETVPFKLN
jgi:SNF2 family DNA or RNA helicase